MKSRTNLGGAMAGMIKSIPDQHWAYLQYQDAISDCIAEYMEQRGVTRAELARALGKSRAYVTKVLRGNVNMTMETFVSLLFALDAKPVTTIVPVSSEKNTCQIHGRTTASILKFGRAHTDKDAAYSWATTKRHADTGRDYDLKQYAC